MMLYLLPNLISGCRSFLFFMVISTEISHTGMIALTTDDVESHVLVLKGLDNNKLKDALYTWYQSLPSTLICSISTMAESG